MKSTTAQPSIYPPQQRSEWIRRQRGPKHVVSAERPYAFLAESEPDESGGELTTHTLFLTNRECPWRCLMCDLWKNTLDESVPTGAIPRQIAYALEQLPPLATGNSKSAAQIKLYNSGSFFDSKAIPPSDYKSIASLVAKYSRVIVECHPSLVDSRVLAFKELLSGSLEIAIGLETSEPEILEKLNKGMRLDDFIRAATFLRDNGISLRAFVLLKPPFVASEDEAIELAVKSAAFAFDHGARVVSIIPTRHGNGALEALAANGEFAPPALRSLETVLEKALALHRRLVFADTWDLRLFSQCDECFSARTNRINDMNRTQRIFPSIQCRHCDTPIHASNKTRTD